jgi:hypothetical protein
MGALETAAVVVTILVAIFNIAWTVWSQRRDRAQRRAERVEDRERWVASGHIVSLKVIHVYDADGTQYSFGCSTTNRMNDDLGLFFGSGTTAPARNRIRLIVARDSAYRHCRNPVACGLVQRPRAGC